MTYFVFAHGGGPSLWSSGQSSRLQNGDRLCDLVVRVSGYRFRGPGSIPGAIRFSEK
jgi:hypothetical protein